MTDDNQLSFNLPSVSRKKITAAFDGGRFPQTAGVMLLALAERCRKVADTLAAHIADRRDPLRSLTRSRTYCAPACWRSAAAIPMATTSTGCAGMRPSTGVRTAADTGRDLCSQPTISRWENAPTLREIIRLTYALVDIWCRSYRSHLHLLSWTSTTRLMLCTATSNWRNGTPTMMSAAFCRSISMMRRPVPGDHDFAPWQDSIG